MNRPIFIFALLLGCSAPLMAASVSDLSLLDNTSNVIVPAENSGNDLEKIHFNNKLTQQIETDREAEVNSILDKHKIINSDPILNRHRNTSFYPSPDNILGVSYTNLINSDNKIFNEVSSSIKDANDFLNNIDNWALNFLNTNIENTNISSLAFRSTILQQENTNFKTVIAGQEGSETLLSEMQGTNQSDSSDGHHEFKLLGILELLSAPELLLKILAENFTVIVLLLTVFLGLKLLLRFVIQKSLKRQQRRKSKRRRSIDGFIK